MAASTTFVEHDILCLDAERGIFYQSFEDFWEQRMEPMQFIPREAKGALAHLREKLIWSAQEQYKLFAQEFQTPPSNSLPTGPDCGGQPPAGELRNPIDNTSSFDVYPEEPSYE